MTAQVTKCPVGYAYGYAPVNGSRQIDELAKDTQDVCQAIRITSIMGARLHGDSIPFELVKKLERRMARNAFVKEMN